MTGLKIEQGRLNIARQVASPNFNARPDQTEIRLVVIHNISLPPSQFGDGYIIASTRILKPFEAWRFQRIY